MTCQDRRASLCWKQGQMLASGSEPKALVTSLLWVPGRLHIKDRLQSWCQLTAMAQLLCLPLPFKEIIRFVKHRGFQAKTGWPLVQGYREEIQKSCSDQQRVRCAERPLVSLPIVTLPLFSLLTDVFANCDTCPVTYGTSAVSEMFLWNVYSIT